MWPGKKYLQKKKLRHFKIECKKKERRKTPFFFFMLHTLLLQCTVDIYLEGTSNVGKSIYSFHLPTKKPIWLAKIEYKGSQKFDWNVPFAETLWQSYPRQRICHHPTGSKRSKNQAQKKFPKKSFWKNFRLINKVDMYLDHKIILK